MVDAAETEFADVGYEAATTEAIAERAGTSIGSLYQFFPHKRALFDAVAQRYQGRASAFFVSLVEEGSSMTAAAAASGAPAETVEMLIDTTLDAFWKFVRTSKGFRAVWVNGHLSHELLDSESKLNEEAARRVAELAEVFAPHLSPKRREVVSTMLVEVAGLMLFAASRRKEPLASSLIEETKTLLKRYATMVFAEDSGGPAKSSSD